VRTDPPDEAALDVLVDRYWEPLFGRCQMLTLNHEKARDLAQEAWYRVLRARHSLKPGGNFPAYLTTIATNLWRDWYRSAKRAGPMADYRLASLDEVISSDDGTSIVFGDAIADLSALSSHDEMLLSVDIDDALKQLTPLLRDVLVARFLTGESCAEIGRRHGRTEQTISAWVRQAIRLMQEHFQKPGRRPHSLEKA